MFAPVKLSLQLVPPGNPRWAAEWTAPDGTRIVGFGYNPDQAMGDMAARVMRNSTGEKVSDAETLTYLHGGSDFR